MKALQVAWELFDFLIKAAQEYVKTPQGQKEFVDIVQAVEGINDESKPQASAPTTASNRPRS